MTALELDPTIRLSRDLKTASATLSSNEIRYLVDAYYQTQENRKRGDNQIRSMAAEPHQVLDWLTTNNRALEKNIVKALDAYTEAHPVGEWLRSIVGIGTVIAAGLIANIDIERAPTVGHIWRFAGLDPTVVWGKGEKRPWNARLKRLCWLAGESFVKFQSHEDDIYGKVYIARKEMETAANERGEYAGQAKEKLEKFNIGKDTEAYKWYTQGKLPPAHIHARAKRYAVKLFLANLHEVMYFIRYRTMPPKPYVLTAMGDRHVHYIGAPNSNIVDGLQEAQRAAHAQPLWERRKVAGT